MSRIAIIGAGVIGLSWADLFTTHGDDVAVFDVNPDAIPRDRGYRVATTIADAVDGADLVQENGPERLDIKRQLLADIATAAHGETIIASSTSSLLPSLLAEGNARADQILVGHPYNPPELMPLVEVVPAPSTRPELVARAVEMYRAVGKNPVALAKEVPGFVGNRVQKAVLDEALWLIQQGVVDAQGFDQVVQGSLGLRWASTGVLEAGHLGGGPGGLGHILKHVGAALNAFDLHTPSREDDDMRRVVEGVERAYGTADTYAERVARRDRITTAVASAVSRENEVPDLYALDIARGAVHRIDVTTGESTALAEGIAEAPDGIVVDGDRLVVSMMGAPDAAAGDLVPGNEPPFTTRNGSLQTLPLAGGTPTVLVERGAFTTGKQVTQDPATGRLYWTDREGRGVYRAERDGSGVTALVLTAGHGPSEAEEHCVGIAVDPGRGHLYWTQKGASKAGQGRIFRAALDLPAGKDPATRTDVETLWSDLPEPIDLHVDAAHGFLYWTDRGAGERGNSLNRAPLPAPSEAGVASTVLATGFTEAIGLALDERHGVAYVGDLGGTIRAITLATGEDRVVTTLAGSATGLALGWRRDAAL
ncbi:3-hydroxyacyl-CoA dehydrogenase NAD-binding domain-containing protein [Demequina sp. NBRC 110057]|uniref:3-hydroxyacyl-CoA dehydrogenase NAD-binding domain-containing protein n=1 Tax=Demequina sp. NBRC 110057 TaxID=1570346 RepID=UPI00190E7D91|nr:3-hydroxyacyl-CoA dehydrogenase NAD-binding domain-containing protein [Demequina sp. NBRC 110057]